MKIEALRVMNAIHKLEITEEEFAELQEDE